MTAKASFAETTAGLSEVQRAALDALIAKKRAERSDAAAVHQIPQIEPDWDNRHEPFSLTDIQQAQWFGRSGLFDITVAGHGYAEFDCRGMDLDRLEEAFRIVIDRHPQMRMVVLQNLQQKVLETVPPYVIGRRDLRGASEAEVARSLADTRERMSHEILEAEVWPIYEVAATLFGEDELRLHVNFDLLVGDAWCFRMIIDEWANLYDDLDDVRPVPEKLTYRDYVRALEALEGTELFERDLAYWRERIKDLAPAPQLPMIRQPSELEQTRAQPFKIVLDKPVWTALRAELRRRGLTPSAFYAAAFSEALCLWTAEPRHTLNVTVFNRLPVHADVDKLLVGEFNSFQLVDVDNRAPASFAERARRVQALLWQHLEHRCVTGVRLMREVARAKGAVAGDTLMPVVFTSTIAHHEGVDDLPRRSPGRRIYQVSQTPQVWMEHHLWEDDDGVSLHIDVVEGLFPEGLIEDLVATYERIVRALADGGAAWEMHHAGALLPPGNAAMWRRYNATEAPLPLGLLHDGFTRAASAHPEKTAVVSARGSVTYGTLDRMSNQVGHWLQRHGARTGDLVGIVAPKGWEQIAAALGVLKAGAAYLPIDQDQPCHRVRELLESGRARLVVTTAANRDRLPPAITPLVIDATTLDDMPAEAPAHQTTADDPAYVIYTSGSTGKPKGCEISHLAALNTVEDINGRFGVGADDVIFAISALSFDLSVYDVFGGLAAGATLVMPASQHPDPAAWCALVDAHGLTIWNSVPALAELFVSYAEETGRVLPETLRLALLSGDWIPLSLPPMLRTINPGMQIMSLGGATEAAIWSIYHPIERIDADWSSVPYGRPLANQTIHVLNAWLEDCPLWATGEIFIGGVGVAKSYYGDAERTAQSFIHHPRTGARLYRTGDLGRMRPGGLVEFLGRKDTQVKLRGYRIELGEIEEALQRTDLVAAGAVSMIGDSNATRQLVAFVRPKTKVEDEAAFTALLEGRLLQWLPKYMVPSSVTYLEQLPLTPNGKVDRKALAALGAESATRTEYVAPRNNTEERIAGLWRELLGVEKVGVYDDFFALGGNSLIASRLIVRLHELFEVELPFAKLFGAANVAALSELVIAQVLADIEAMDDD